MAVRAHAPSMFSIFISVRENLIQLREMLKELLLEQMTWRDVKEYADKVKVVIVPLGSMEPHGYHLPLATDTILAYEIAKDVAKNVSVFITPPIPFGVQSGGEFGALSISFNTLYMLLRDVSQGLCEQGFKFIIYLLGHGGLSQKAAVNEVAREIIRKYDVKMAMLHISELIDHDPKDKHAGEWETSLMLALKSELVKGDMVKEFPEYPKYMMLPKSVSKHHVHGDPTKASKEKGQKYIQRIIDEIVSLIKRMHEE